MDDTVESIDGSFTNNSASADANENPSSTSDPHNAESVHDVTGDETMAHTNPTTMYAFLF
jgi:hypothetical protein